MAGTAVVAMRCANDHAVADGVRALLAAGHDVVLVASDDAAGAASLAIGPTRSSRRPISIVAHTLVDPADPAFAHPDGARDPAPLGVLEAEAIAALVGSGFPVVVTAHVPVVPCGDAYQTVPAILDEPAAAQRLAGDLGALALVFVVEDDVLGPGDGVTAADLDMTGAEDLAAAEPRLASELRAAVRFLRAGGQLAVVTTPAHLATVLDGSDDGRALRIHRELPRPAVSDAPVVAAGWC